MKAFVGGVVLGAAITSVVFVALTHGDAADVPAEQQVPPVAPAERAAERGRKPVAPERKRVRVSPAPAPAPAVPFAAGTAVLGVGDAYDFGADAVRADRSGADIVCHDIRHGASLACAYGAVPADLPLDDTGLPRKLEEVAALVTDAPLDLPRRQASLPRSLDTRHSGVELIRSRSGAVYKVYVTAVDGDPDVLKRRVRIAYEEVPAVEGGGVVGAVVTAFPDGAPLRTRADVARIIAAGAAMPGDSFARFLGGTYRHATDLPPSLVLNEQRYLLLDEPLTTSVTIKRRGAVYATRGMAGGSSVTLDSYSAVAVEGELGGKVDVKSYGYVFAGGDVTGEVNLNSYATLVIDGDLRGTVKASSYTDILLRGRILGTLDASGSCWSTFYFEHYMTRGQLELLVGDASVTLHVRESDMPAGEYENIGEWRKVIVGDLVWSKLTR